MPLQTQVNGSDGRFNNKNATFGQRRSVAEGLNSQNAAGKGKMREDRSADGGMEVTFVPSGAADDAEPAERGGRGKNPARRKGVELFGAGLEKGGREAEVVLSEGERKGRTQRRRGMRSGSKNTFRRM